jgi:hypothetical protein
MNGALDTQNVSELCATSSGITPEVIMSEKCYIHIGITDLWVGKAMKIFI